MNDEIQNGSLNSLKIGTVMKLLDFFDHVLEGRRSQGGLTPNSLEFDLLGAFRC